MTGVAERVTRGLVGMNSRSLSGRARARRFEMLLARFPRLAEMRVLDLGGEPHSWRDAAVLPREVVLLNLGWQVARADYDVGDGSRLRIVPGDACAPPDDIRADRFDLVFSNSVIEHVGDHERRRAFADWARRLGEHYWVQTPNRYFPIEPHFILPGAQFMPRGMAARALVHWPIGSFAGRGWGYDRALSHVDSIHLLDASEMRGHFPDATLLRERWGGLTKSLIATR